MMVSSFKSHCLILADKTLVGCLATSGLAGALEGGSVSVRSQSWALVFTLCGSLTPDPGLSGALLARSPKVPLRFVCSSWVGTAVSLQPCTAAGFCRSSRPRNSHFCGGAEDVPEQSSRAPARI